MGTQSEVGRIQNCLEFESRLLDSVMRLGQLQYLILPALRTLEDDLEWVRLKHHASLESVSFDVSYCSASAFMAAINLPQMRCLTVKKLYNGQVLRF